MCSVSFVCSSMNFDLFSCTFENLNSLKFNELQKLSSQYRVNKRWAKKREIIDKLLLLRDQEIAKMALIPDSGRMIVSSEENGQWIDGNRVFSSDVIDEVSNNDDSSRRLTYNVSSAVENVDRRLTFNIVKNEGNQIMRDGNVEIYDPIDKRLTYNADEIKRIQKTVKNGIENCKTNTTITNIQQSAPVQDINFGATTETLMKKRESSEPSKHLLTVSEKYNINNKEVHFNGTTNGAIMITSHNQTDKSTGSKSAKATMLTVPYSRIAAQSRKLPVTEVKDNHNKVKLPEKLSTANKMMKSRGDISKTPNTFQKEDPQLYKRVKGITKSLADQGEGLTTKPNILNPSLKSELSRLDTTRNILPRRKSKTEDNVLVTNLKPSRKLKFYSPTESGIKSQKRLSEPNSHHVGRNLQSKIPKARPIVEAHKPVTANKMPNFSKIHQRQFEQMDSLLDYKRKKEERAKKLFGITQPGIPVKVNKGKETTTLFQFKSSQNEKENQVNKTIGTIRKPLQSNVKVKKEKPHRQDMMNHVGSKLNIVKNMKEQNRKHLHGVRTNKRFELQMKFRKM